MYEIQQAVHRQADQTTRGSPGGRQHCYSEYYVSRARANPGLKIHTQCPFLPGTCFFKASKALHAIYLLMRSALGLLRKQAHFRSYKLHMEVTKTWSLLPQTVTDRNDWNMTLGLADIPQWDPGRSVARSALLDCTEQRMSAPASSSLHSMVITQLTLSFHFSARVYGSCLLLLSFPWCQGHSRHWINACWPHLVRFSEKRAWPV